MWAVPESKEHEPIRPNDVLCCLGQKFTDEKTLTFTSPWKKFAHFEAGWKLAGGHIFTGLEDQAQPNRC